MYATTAKHKTQKALIHVNSNHSLTKLGSSIKKKSNVINMTGMHG